VADLKAQLEITADASGVEAGVGRAKKSIASLGKTAGDAGKEAAAGFEKIGDGAGSSTAKVDAATKNLIGSIQRTTASMEAGGRASSRYFELLAQQRGVNVDALRPYLTQLDQVSAKQAQASTALQAGTVQFNRYGLSAKQTAAALRQVPSQLTDIFVSLQGGQAPLTVLLQQGGQLRDIFGGAVPALKALGGALLGLINPFTVLAALAGGLGFAYFKGSKEADEFAKSLILTGNAAGTTTGQLRQIAVAVSGVVGTQAKAAEVVAKLAASGQVTRASLEEVATAAIKLERTAGRAIEETVKDFAQLGKEPVEASVKLNEQYNFLTLSVYEQIKALKEQGRAAEAAGVAQASLASAAITRADQLTERLGSLERAWKAITREAAGAWDAMLNVGRAQSPESQLSVLRRRLEQMDSTANLSPEFGGSSGSTATAAARAALVAQIESLEDITRETSRYASAQAAANAVQASGIAAEREISRIREASRSSQQKLNDELKKYRENIESIRRANPNSALLDPAKVAADEAAIRNRFRSAVSASTSGVVRDDAATRMLQQLREAEAVSRKQLQVEEQLTESEKKKAEFVQLVADLKEKRVLTAEQKSLLAAKEAIVAQLDRNIAVEKEVKARADATKEIEKQQRALEQFNQRAAQLAESIRSSNEARSEAFSDRLSGFGRGDEVREQIEAQIRIQREFRRYQDQLTKAAKENLLGSKEYEQASELVRRGLAVALEDQRDYYAQLLVLQGKWETGANRSLENYLASVRNVSAQTDRLFTNAFLNMEDALVRFITTGKLDFKEFANSILADITRIIIRQQIMLPLLQSLGLGTPGGTGTNFFASLFGGGRASGGPVSAGKLYRVNERDPEMLSVMGRDYLMMGSQGGEVKNAAPSGRSLSVVNHFTIHGQMTRQTQGQIATDVARSVRREAARGTA
jgi:lambda family phage tail tape measure protein